MKWPFGSKEIDTTIIRLAEAINRKNGSHLVNYHDSTYYSVEISFYADFKLYTYVDLGFMPYYQVRLLDNGFQTIVLDGTITPFVEAASISPLVLTKQTVFDYAKVVLCCMEKEDGFYHLVANIDEVDFSTEPTAEQFQKLELCIHSPRILKDNGTLHIIASLIYGDSVFEATIQVSQDGRVEILNEIKLLEKMPVKELMLE